MLIIHC